LANNSRLDEQNSVGQGLLATPTQHHPVNQLVLKSSTFKRETLIAKVRFAKSGKERRAWEEELLFRRVFSAADYPAFLGRKRDKAEDMSCD
jgi:hypothetical protein